MPNTAAAAPDTTGARHRGPRVDDRDAGRGNGRDDHDGRDGRQRVIDEAARAFLELGYQGASLRHIAKAAGMQAGSVYYHFESKADLIGEIFRLGMDAVERRFAATDAELDADTPGGERLRAHVRAHLGALFDNSLYTAVHVGVYHSTPVEVREANVGDRDAYERRWTALLEHLRDSGELRDGLDLGLQRLLLLGAMNSALEWFDPAGPRSLDDLAGVLSDQVWRAIAAPGAAGTQP